MIIYQTALCRVYRQDLALLSVVIPLFTFTDVVFTCYAQEHSGPRSARKFTRLTCGHDELPRHAFGMPHVFTNLPVVALL